MTGSNKPKSATKASCSHESPRARGSCGALSRLRRRTLLTDDGALRIRGLPAIMLATGPQSPDAFQGHLGDRALGIGTVDALVGKNVNDLEHLAYLIGGARIVRLGEPNTVPEREWDRRQAE
jgi:hypothetical protein